VHVERLRGFPSFMHVERWEPTRLESIGAERKPHG
jgi:hypothetical protein